MSNGSSKFHMKVGEIEISIEGNPDFVTRQYREMEKELNLSHKMAEALSEATGQKETSQEETSTISQESTPATTSTKSASRPAKEAPSKAPSKAPQKDEFGEWLKALPKGLKNRDKALVAAYYNQQKSQDNVFRVRDLNNTLKNNDIRITNPSSLIKNLANSNNIIKQISRQGRQVYYQFTKEGEGYIKDLLAVNRK